LEAESRGLFAEAHFGSPLCLFIATVEDGSAYASLVDKT